MLRAIIVDDEQKSCENLKILLEDFCKDVVVLQMVNTVSDGFDAIHKYKPDVIFLDIQMQKETGFDLLKKFGDINFEIVFITAYSEYAINAIKFSAIDYLLKPIDINDLKTAVEKLGKKTSEKLIGQKVDILMQNFRSENAENYRLAISDSDGITFVNINEIIYCEGSSNYTNFYLQNGKKHIVAKTLKEYEELLSSYNFFRIHNSYLINLKEVKKYFRGDGGYVQMSNDEKLDVSKRKKEYFLKKISNNNLL
jgi:two-component system, LytTR family, response regulator